MDENQMIGIYLKQISFFDFDFLLSQPSVEGYLADKTTGECVKANSSISNLNLYTSPFTLSQREFEKRGRTDGQNWSKLLVIDKNFSDLNRENQILLFEICKTVHWKKTQELEKVRIAFAFLVTLASDGSTNTIKQLKLQLYKIGKDCKISHQDCNIYHLYSEHKLKKISGFLELSVRGVVPIKVVQSVNQSANHSSPSREKFKIENFPSLKSIPDTWKWSRLPPQSCKVPNRIHKTFSLGRNGFSCLRFGRTGSRIAAAVLSKIVVLDVISGSEVATLNGHVGFIYELDWSSGDESLLSVSNDCLAAVWNPNLKSPPFVLPHPSYVYCGKWLRGDEEIVTGGKDHLIRHWRKTEEGFRLAEEIGGHSGFISSLAVQDESLLVSGDSTGCLMVRRLSGSGWTPAKKISFPELSRGVIDSILFHSGRRRIIVSVRSRHSHLIDFVSGVILQNYESAGANPLARSVPCLTPCGSFFFSFGQNGEVGIWEVNTGKLFASYDRLFPIDRFSVLSGSIDYHPHEHMVGIVSLGRNHSLLMLNCDSSEREDDSEKLGLSFRVKKI